MMSLPANGPESMVIFGIHVQRQLKLVKIGKYTLGGWSMSVIPTGLYFTDENAF